MTQIKEKRIINASKETVFKVVSDFANLPTAVPEVVRIEFISTVRSGLGTRFREVRLVNGKESITELEVTEYREYEHIRMVADSHGTVWDSVFRLTPVGEATELEVVMHARAHKLLARMIHFLMRGFYKSGIGKHLNAIKNFCESL